MNDKSNILGSLMGTSNRQQQQQQQQQQPVGSMDLRQQQSIRPTSGASSSTTSKQHKLKQRFTVIRKLGKGTYGKVQLAINKQTGQEVAIKTIKKTKIENEQDLQRVRREIQIMSSIEHPHIIHIYEVFENKDKIVLVMQYAPGGELYEYVSQSKVLDDLEARRLFRQIATAIYYCHQNKICHRDLKLENILLDEKNNAKLADFGLSNVFDKRCQLKTFCGSPLYASPEIVQGSPYEGPEVDCWSLGVLLYTLVYGAMPFDGSNFKRLVKQISEACYFEPKQRSQASPLIRRLLCADPLKRATILDICSDPWVNGLSTGNLINVNSQFQCLTPNEQQQQQQPTHTSLLQVAQDMANLTPVRLDILLALTPTSPPTTAQPNDENRPPPATQRRSTPPPRDFEVPGQRPSSLNLEPAFMEVDETAHVDSPVASYIVRDLDVASEEKPEVECEPELAELSVEPQMEQEIEVQAVEEPKQDEKREEDVKESPMMQDQDEDKGLEVDHSTMSADQAKVESKQEGETMPGEEVGAEPEVRMEVDEPAVESANRLEQQAASEEPEQISNQEEVDAKPEEKPSDFEAKDKPDTGVEVGEKEPAKPKKVKKKIVVVKKRKKVAKKGADDEVKEKQEEDKTKQGSDKETSQKEQSDENNSKQQSPKEKKATKASGSSRGKVKIPDTFQYQPSATTESQTPPKNTLESRRPSQLVADVSQKLLQQLQNMANDSSKSEQPQLHGVKVADKKDEFERRASLAQAAATTPTPRQSQPTNQAQYEPERVDSLQESIGMLDKVMQTIVEPVQRLEPLEIELLELLKQQHSIATEQASSEGQTPTSSEKAQQLDKEIKRKLSECAEKLDAEYKLKQASEKLQTDQNPNYLSLESTSEARGDRSDSVETIKAIESPETVIFEALEPTERIRSSMVIDLGPKRSDKGAESSQKEPLTTKKNSTSSMGSQMALGPAPITRSYKKVTFTKDGACITETGKIYSTQAHDGTMRRVERKSKVTHFPQRVSDDSLSSKEAGLQESSKETVYEGCANDGSAWHKESRQSSSHRSLVTGKPFGKLIMPSTGLPGDFDEDFDRHSLFGGWKSKPESLGRADSTSSCSSSSTDVFDDIFDTWTGALSMFNRRKSQRPSSGFLDERPGSSLFERAFGGDPMLKQSSLFSPHVWPGKHSKRGHRNSRQSGASSVSGTPRSESVEPQFESARLNSGRRPEVSGYDSDAQAEPERRSASAMGSARGTFGSSNLFGRNTNSLFHEEELDELMAPFGHGRDQEHMSLRQRLAQQHRQLWKGSTPSLFEEKERTKGNSEFGQHQRQKQNLAHFLRPQELHTDVEAAPDTSGQRTRSQKTQQAPNWSKPPLGAEVNKQNLEQSQSSSSFLRKSAALQASPAGKNTVEQPTSKSLPPRVQKSLSKTSLITSQLENVQLGDDSTKRSIQSSANEAASFIELKRSPSSQASKQQFVQRVVSSSTSRVVSSSASNASSAFWEGRVSPAGFEDNRNEADVDSRVQSWLRESSGNLSGSTAVSSSTSAATPSSKGDLTRRVRKENVQQQQVLFARPGLAQQQSGVLLSSSRQWEKSDQDGAYREEHVSLEQEELVRRHEVGSGVNEELKAVGSNRSKASLTLRKSPSGRNEAGKQVCNVVKKEAEVFSSSFSSKFSSSGPVESEDAAGLSWLKASEQQASSAKSFVVAENEEFSGNDDSGGSADLESKSSSSLLDQLKSRGYRSMIDQRMVSNCSLENISQQKQVIQASSSSSKCVQSSSRLVMSSSNTNQSKVFQQKQQSSKQESSSNFAEFDSDKQENAAEPEQEQEKVCVVEEEKSRLKVDDTFTTGQNGRDESLEGREEDEEEVAAQEEEIDEDVREAKANIKSYLESVKETQLFLNNLKKMQQEEENLDRQRQQLFLFNNLMLHTKLNGINRMVNSDSSASAAFQFKSSGINSAPIRSTLGPFNAGPSKTFIDVAQDVESNGFIPSAALNFEPTYTIPASNNTTTTTTCCSYSSPSSARAGTTTNSFYRQFTSSNTKPLCDPLEPVQPLAFYVEHSPAQARFSPNRRSRSQLSDQFSDYKRSQRALSANLELQLDSSSNVYFPSRSKRSTSVLRHPTHKLIQPMMSEYRSAYVDHSCATLSPPGQLSGRASPMSPGVGGTTDESDDGMSAYRASAYVPKIVPQGMSSVEPRQGRTLQRRSYRKEADLSLNSHLHSRLNKSPESCSPTEFSADRVERRTSLQPERVKKEAASSASMDSSSPASYRRLSLNESSKSVESNSGLNSRLSQLELRIQENRKRREQLLQQSAGSLVNESKLRAEKGQEEATTVPTSNRTARKELSPALPSSRSPVSTTLKAKPSRLESMEARIKRKSYCVRVADCSPERSQLRSQVSLEKWRQSSNARSTTAATSSNLPRNSLTNFDANNLFSSLNSKTLAPFGDSSSSVAENYATNKSAQTNGLKQADNSKEDD